MHRPRLAPAVWVVVAGLGGAVAGLALWTQAVPEPVIQKYRARMVATMIGESTGFVARTPDFVLSRDAKEYLIARGTDKSGLKWRLRLPQADRGLWRAGQGQEHTYYFTGYTGGNGMAPPDWILALSFDDAGRPVPFYMTTYNGYDMKGIRDLLRLDATEQVLLQAEWFEDSRLKEDEIQARAGYHVTSAYCRQGPYWRKCDGLHGGISFPIFERWVIMQDTEPKRVPPPDPKDAFSPNYGNDPRSGVRTTIVKWGSTGILTQPDLGCELVSAIVVVADGPSGREIDASFFDASKPGGLIQEIVRRQSPVAITGLYQKPGTGYCYAMVVWASF